MIPLYQADAFTNKPFGGNPAAICLLEDDPDEAWLQSVAVEMNLSETAFVRCRAANDFDLRWFTPAYEVALCGHATLAAAHVLWTEGHAVEGEAIRFHTKSGILAATRRNEKIELDFPATPASAIEPPPGLLEALGVDAEWVGHSTYDQFVVVDSEESVRSVSPDFQRLGAIKMRGVIVTARSQAKEYDFVSRYFAPAAGINEDPVTGSAHCCLGPYWATRLEKNPLTGLQASARTGIVDVRVENDRVYLGGQAVTVLRGQFLGHYKRVVASCP